MDDATLNPPLIQVFFIGEGEGKQQCLFHNIMDDKKMITHF
jgi:hypothetical protein